MVVVEDVVETVL